MNHTRIVKWAQVKDQVCALNPFIGNNINELPGSDHFELLEASYQFGEDIMKYGEFFIPYEGKLHHYQSSALPSTFSELLNYYWLGVPFGLVLENTTESYILLKTHLAPIRLLEPGNTFSLLTIFEKKTEPYFLYQTHSMSAGCRSLITLPKLAHQQYNDRLVKKFKMSTEHLCPKTLDQQWPFFRDLATAPEFPKTWTNKILFFSKAFIELLEKQIPFKCSILDTIWKASSFQRSEYTYNLIWSMFVDQYVPLSIRNTANVIETAKHCLRVALQQVPGFVPCINNLPGPIADLTSALLDVYKIRYYFPVFMYMSYYNGTQPVYLSLQKPAFLNSFPQKSNANQTVIELEHICKILQDFKDYVLSDQLPFSIAGSKLESALNHTQFKYYHPQALEGSVSNQIQDLYTQDPRFLEFISTLHPKASLAFPVNSIFFNGCIVIRSCP